MSSQSLTEAQKKLQKQQAENYKDDTFYLGLTMAGAVSAGAYTGGVLDYLFEVLDKWERAKTGELEIPGFAKEDIPKHKVMIDAIGGTSAGGMTTAMAALYAIKGEINPVTDNEADKPGGKKNNLLYDSWVNLADDTKGLTLTKGLSKDDIVSEQKILSLLNSVFIDEIAENAFSLDGPADTDPSAKLPPFISSAVEMLITHTMLQGIPLAVNFAHQGSALAQPPSHATYEHLLFSHFKLNGGEAVNPDQYIWLNPFDPRAKEHLKKAAKATGAFPVGLKFREFSNKEFSPEYLKNMVGRIIEKNMGVAEPEIKKEIIWDEDTLRNYNSITVDGGALNNEPYSEVMSILKHRYGDAIGTYSPSDASDSSEGIPFQKYGMIMIDPFPDFYHLQGDYEKASDLMGVAPGIIGTLWDQAKVKRHELIEQFRNKAYRGVIFPVKYKPGKDNGKYRYPLACGTLEAFSGFIDVNFRHHDFFLGRNNARNFLRAFLSVPYDPDNHIVHPLHTDQYWTEEMRQRFMIHLNVTEKDDQGNETKVEKQFLPLIPDINLLLEEAEQPEREPLYWISDYSVPEKPKVTEASINSLKDSIYLRTSAMVSLMLDLDYEQKRPSELSWWANLIKGFIEKGEKEKRGFVKRWLDKRKSKLGLRAKRGTRQYAADVAADLAVQKILGELKKTGFLEGSEEEPESGPAGHGKKNSPVV
ncbi:MAG: hypothetical protein HEP71_03160 [Roseivirga sp.]|nr:hypothetical protein [Roseivirga sp.]